MIYREQGSYSETASGVRRYNRGSGQCDWCGQDRKTTFDYRYPGQLDYRLNRPDHRFCNLDCWHAYHV